MSAPILVAWQGLTGIVALDGSLTVARLGVAIPSGWESIARTQIATHMRSTHTTLSVVGRDENGLLLVDWTSADGKSLIGSLVEQGVAVPHATILNESDAFLVTIQVVRGRKAGYWGEELAGLRSPLSDSAVTLTTPIDHTIPTGLALLFFLLTLTVIGIIAHLRTRKIQSAAAEAERIQASLPDTAVPVRRSVFDRWIWAPVRYLVRAQVGLEPGMPRPPPIPRSSPKPPPAHT